MKRKSCLSGSLCTSACFLFFFQTWRSKISTQSQCTEPFATVRALDKTPPFLCRQVAQLGGALVSETWGCEFGWHFVFFFWQGGFLHKPVNSTVRAAAGALGAAAPLGGVAFAGTNVRLFNAYCTSSFFVLGIFNPESSKHTCFAKRKPQAPHVVITAQAALFLDLETAKWVVSKLDKSDVLEIPW